MDYERLAKAVEEANHQAQADARYEAKQQEKLTKRNLRRQERLTPYKELKDRNQLVFDRAYALASAVPPVEAPSKDFPNKSTAHQVNVVLGAARQTLTTPDHMLVAQILTSQWKYNGQPREQAQLKFVSVDRKAAEQVQRKPLLLPGKCKILADESNYVSGFNGALERNASENVSGRTFSPIKAMHRFFDLKHINEYLQTVEQSLDIIESAARDPELNPVLARGLNSEAAESAATA